MLKLLIRSSMRAEILLYIFSHFFFCFSIARVRYNFATHDFSTYSLAYSEFLLETIVTNERVNSSFSTRRE